MDSPNVLEPLTECGDNGTFDILKCLQCVKPCVTRDLGLKLRNSGLKCTRQRIELARLLFAHGDRHFTADILHREARDTNIPVSLATVYNTLQHFAKAGLIRRLATGGQKAWFDTNVSEHHHLYFEDEQRIVDVPKGYLTVSNLPPVPEDSRIDRIDVVVHLKRNES